jgi:tripartite-type tricarboxylate transporter receptor subunit TctC
MKRRFVFSAVLALLGAPALADTYPSHAIRMIVPFTPGGSTDTLARQLADQLRAGLNQSVVVENRPGAGGTIGSDAVAKSAPDGYTLLFVPGAHTINASLYPKLSYDTLEDFAPIVKIADVATMIVVSPAVPVHSVKELLALAKSHPGKVNFGSAGIGTVTHMTGELFKMMSGAKLKHIPYKGSSQAMNDLLGGQVEVMFANFPGTLQHVRSGKLRAIAVNGLVRSPLLPDTPTVAESGVPGFNANTWYGVLAPAGTPRPIIDRLNREFGRALGSPEVQKMIRAEGGEPVGGSPEEFAAFIRKDMAKWADVIKRTGAAASK